MKFISNAKYNEPVESGTIFHGKIGDMRISVHRIVHCDGWYLSVPDLGISQMKLKSDTPMKAIKEAESALKLIVENLSKNINSFCEAEIEISRY